jgi:hypothetical protein
VTIRSIPSVRDVYGVDGLGCAQHRRADRHKCNRGPLRFADRLMNDQPSQQNRNNAEGGRDDHSHIGCNRVGTGEESKITDPIERTLQADKGKPWRPYPLGYSLHKQYCRDEYEAGPAADQQGLELTDKRRGSLSCQNNCDLGKTRTDGDEYGCTIAPGLGWFTVRYCAAGDEEAGSNDDDRGRPLNGARPCAEQHINCQHQSRMSRNDWHHDGNRTARDAHVKQNAHGGHAKPMSHGNGAAKRRPNEPCITDKKPCGRSGSPDEEHYAIGQRSSQSAGAEARHEVGHAETDSARQSKQSREHAAYLTVKAARSSINFYRARLRYSIRFWSRCTTLTQPTARGL